MKAQYGKIILGFKTLLKWIGEISSLSNDNNFSQIIVKIQKTLIIQYIRDLNWFNNLIIYLPKYIKAIGNFSFFDIFQ